MYQEKKVVIISVIVLLVALGLVYALFFGLKWDNLFDNTSPKIAQVEQSTWVQQKDLENDKILSQTGVWLVDDILENTWETQENTWITSTTTWDQKIYTWSNAQTGKQENNVGSSTWSKENITSKKDDDVWNLLAETDKKPVQPTSSQQLASQPQTTQQAKPTTQSPSDIKILHWTQIYTWRLDIINELGVGYKYILKDSNGVYFVYLGNSVSDLRYKASKIGWNTVEITDKKVIIDNSLFGEKVIFINIPKYQKQYVFIVVKPTMQNEYWLMQVNFKDYYMLKKYLQTLFTF